MYARNEGVPIHNSSTIQITQKKQLQQKMSKKKQYKKVPAWALHEDTFVRFSQPSLEWLKALLRARREVLAKGGDKLVHAFQTDEDILRFCVTLNNLKELNLSLCQGRILLDSEELYVPTDHTEIDARIGMVKEMILSADGMSPLRKKEVFPNSDDTDDINSLQVQGWRHDVELQQATPHFELFIERLTKFNNKSDQIVFSTDAWIQFNKKLSTHRIELDEKCREFLRVFLPPGNVRTNSGEAIDSKQSADN